MENQHLVQDYLGKDIESKKIEQFIHNIKIMEHLTEENPDINLLKSYKGFGGLKSCFSSKTLYKQLINSLGNIFVEDKYNVFNTLKNSCRSAYYTPPEIVNFIYRYLGEVCKFQGGDILEPSCGNGIFFEYMPKNIFNNSQITGIEMDILTSMIVKKIYPNINIINNPLQNINFDGKKYDLIIGNPPYSGEIIIDPFMKDISNYTIHHYFTAKCIRLLNDNGILAFVLPSYFFDIPRKNTRAIIDGEAVLIDAVRLPENLFDQATVTVDVIFFRKCGNKIHNFSDTVIFEYDNKKENINEFWQKKPHRILGELELKWVNAYKHYVPCCVTNDKNRILNYLNNCKFDNSTIDDYNNICRTQENEVVINNITNEVGESLYDNFIIVEELFMEVNYIVDKVILLNNDLIKIRNKLMSVHK